MTMRKLMTAKQVAEEFLPTGSSVRTVDHMRRRGLAAVKPGRSWLYSRDDVEQFIQEQKVRTCLDPIAVPTSSTGLIATATTSIGQRTVDPRSGAQARATANKLKQRSRRSSANGTDVAAPPAPVIQITSRSRTL